MGLGLSEVFTKRRQMEIMISCSRNVAQNGEGGRGNRREKKRGTSVPGKLGSSSFARRFYPEIKYLRRLR